MPAPVSFWGLKMVPGAVYTNTVEKAIHISSACISASTPVDPSGAQGRTSVLLTSHDTEGMSSEDESDMDGDMDGDLEEDTGASDEEMEAAPAKADKADTDMADSKKAEAPAAKAGSPKSIKVESSVTDAVVDEELQDAAEEAQEEDNGDSEFVLTTLCPGKADQQALNITLNEGETFSLQLIGPNVVYLTGNYVEDDMYEEEDDSEMDGEVDSEEYDSEEEAANSYEEYLALVKDKKRRRMARAYMAGEEDEDEEITSMDEDEDEDQDLSDSDMLEDQVMADLEEFILAGKPDGTPYTKKEMAYHIQAALEDNGLLGDSENRITEVTSSQEEEDEEEQDMNDVDEELMSDEEDDDSLTESQIEEMISLGLITEASDDEGQDESADETVLQESTPVASPKMDSKKRKAEAPAPAAQDAAAEIKPMSKKAKKAAAKAAAEAKATETKTAPATTAPSKETPKAQAGAETEAAEAPRSKKALKRAERKAAAAAAAAAGGAPADKASADKETPVKTEKKTPAKADKAADKKPQADKADKAADKATPKVPKMQTLPSGLKFEDTVVGTGPAAKNGRKVAVRYIGRLVNSKKVFDSNTKGAPFKFTLGKGEVIKGWDLGVNGMQIGGSRKVIVPAALGYGASGAPPDIPPHSTLEFEIKLLEIK